MTNTYITKSHLNFNCPRVYKDLKTGVLFTTNYVDYFDWYIMSPRGLVPCAEVEEVKINNSDKVGILIVDYRK